MNTQKIKLFSVALALVGLVSPALRAQSAPPVKPGYPVAIQECEDRGEAHVCSTWRWNGTDYEGSWPNGSIGRMKLRLDQASNGQGTRVTVIRDDREGVAAWIHGIYTGELRNGKVEDGEAHWIHSGIIHGGTWDATFVYDQPKNGAM